jgi:hypothetical protein
MMRKSALGLLALILLASLVSCPGREASEKDKSRKQAHEQPNWSKHWDPSPTARPTSLVLKMNGEVLRIPREFLAQNPPQSPFVEVWAYWPGMVPISSDKKGKFETADIIAILIRLDPERRHGEKIVLLKRAIANGWVKEPSQPTQYPGLLEYRNATTNEAWIYRAKDPVITPGGNPLVIGCDEHLRTFGRNAWECQTDMRLPGEISLKYRFSNKHLKDWRAIYDDVREFVDSLKRQ